MTQNVADIYDQLADDLERSGMRLNPAFVTTEMIVTGLRDMARRTRALYFFTGQADRIDVAGTA